MSYFKLETWWDNVNLAVTQHFYTLGHSGGIQEPESWGVTGMKILQSVSRVQLPKCTLGENTKRSQLTFQAFRSQVTSWENCSNNGGGIFQAELHLQSYVYFYASLVTSDWLSWPHPTVASRMLQQWHIGTLLFKKMGNKQIIYLSERWMAIPMSMVSMHRSRLQDMFSLKDLLSSAWNYLNRFIYLSFKKSDW